MCRTAQKIQEKLYNADCLSVMKDMPASSIDMAYLDPPFFTQKQQTLTDPDGNKHTFSDKWDSLDDYLEFMRLRLSEVKRLLKPTGSIFLHCDTSASHYLRILLDDIFGSKNFRGEIIWSYKRWSNSRKGLMNAHQTIFYYSKTENYTFNTIYTDYSPTTNIDQILQLRMRNESGKAVYKKDDSGEVIGAGEKKGVPLADVWEIPFLNPRAKERTGYPTQKPVELLERIIKISTNQGDTILDPFCGSGTALVSAKLLGRNFIGIDTNADAIGITRSRLETPLKTTSVLLKTGKDAYKTKSEYELSILRQFDCHIVQRNKGIDAILRKHYLGHPVAIKIQKDTESFAESLSLLENAGRKKRCSFSILITHEKEWEKTKHVLDNIIVINSYSTQFENIIDEILSQAVASVN